MHALTHNIYKRHTFDILMTDDSHLYHQTYRVSPGLWISLFKLLYSHHSFNFLHVALYYCLHFCPLRWAARFFTFLYTMYQNDYNDISFETQTAVQ